MAGCKAEFNIERGGFNSDLEAASERDLVVNNLQANITEAGIQETNQKELFRKYKYTIKAGCQNSDACLAEQIKGLRIPESKTTPEERCTKFNKPASEAVKE